MITKNRLEKLIKERKFRDLFIQLGWDLELPDRPIILEHNEQPLEANYVVQKYGFVVCLCDATKNYPQKKSERRQLVSQLAKHHYEHLLILLGEGKQCWTLAIRPQNRPMRTVEVEWHENQDVQLLLEKLQGIFFSIQDEETINLIDVVERVRGSFTENSESVTRGFYDKFREKLSEFSEFIQGIQHHVPKDWYAALMLNRLMFIYFIQKKGFLNGDRNYLENRLKQTQQRFGKDKFDKRFYRSFLRVLFDKGFGTPLENRSPELQELLGKVPYLDGGLFDVHQIEQENSDINIPDKAFENLFAFFGQYNWHLDTRTTASGKDINPDVIGYIFEKYINDRASMGAYYTQEDITGYIARNTIIPSLLNTAKEKCANAFDPKNGIWRFLRENPDNYIHEAVKKGCDITDQQIPDNIRQGIDANLPNLLERRKDWNSATEERFALPTEVWRETIARRKRYFQLKAKIENGEVCEIDDLITHNLDIERFASDALRYYEGSDFISAFYEAIAGRKSLKSNWKGTRGITVLDPACGSGAFLFAALNVLEPLYERCVERMDDFVDEDDTLRKQGKRKGTKKHPLFRAVLEDIDKHQNPKYWIYKTIILNNLYGVDIMREATEIAKLRLFLKLAAEAEYEERRPNLGLEPLPDIDFNIRPGNSLVGFASMDQFEKSAEGRLDLDNFFERIRTKASEVERANQAFREAQDEDSESYQRAKQGLAKLLDSLNGEMNRYLGEQYGKQEDSEYKKWLEAFQPFHWPAEFYGIIEEDGGFDVVIGNPPYIEYSKTKKQYKIRDYKTESCGNLYALFIERAMGLGGSPMGMIVQLPLICTDRMMPAQSLFKERKRKTWFSSFDDRPGKLFEDLQHIRATIFLSLPNGSNEIRATQYQRWITETRQELFQKIDYADVSDMLQPGIFPKIGDEVGKGILRKIGRRERRSKTSGKSICYFHNAPGYWIRATDFVPYFWNEREGEKQSEHVKRLTFEKRGHAMTVCALLNSSIFYWWFILCSNCRDLNLRELESFPFDPAEVNESHRRKLSTLVKKLMTDYKSHAVRKKTRYKTTGRVIYDEFYPRRSKHIIDEIDKVLAEHYALTQEELDYIINYDIKYRTGLG